MCRRRLGSANAPRQNKTPMTVNPAETEAVKAAGGVTERKTLKHCCLCCWCHTSCSCHDYRVSVLILCSYCCCEEASVACGVSLWWWRLVITVLTMCVLLLLLLVIRIRNPLSSLRVLPHSRFFLFLVSSRGTLFGKIQCVGVNIDWESNLILLFAQSVMI